jgi:hypothetical protein
MEGSPGSPGSSKAITRDWASDDVLDDSSGSPDALSIAYDEMVKVHISQKWLQPFDEIKERLRTYR